MCCLILVYRKTMTHSLAATSPYSLSLARNLKRVYCLYTASVCFAKKIILSLRCPRRRVIFLARFADSQVEGRSLLPLQTKGEFSPMISWHLSTVHLLYIWRKSWKKLVLVMLQVLPNRTGLWSEILLGYKKLILGLKSHRALLKKTWLISVRRQFCSEETGNDANSLATMSQDCRLGGADDSNRTQSHAAENIRKHGNATYFLLGWA